MGQNISRKSNDLKIEQLDRLRVKITNIGTDTIAISYHGMDKEIKPAESVIVLKMVLETLKARLVK